MYYRLTTIQIDPSNTKKMYAHADSQRKIMMKLPGIQYIRVTEIDESQFVSISCYDSEENADAAKPKVAEIMDGMANIASAHLQRIGGVVTWKM